MVKNSMPKDIMNMCIMINSVIAFGSAKYGLYFTYEFSKHRK